MKPSIFSLSELQLVEASKAMGFASFRSKQLIHWLFEKRVSSLDLMTNLPKDMKSKLAVEFDWSLPKVVTAEDAEDGASKLLLEVDGGKVVESVILRHEGRTSLCVSSQVGCKLACSFCQTGKLGFFRNLSSGEIIGQFLVAQNILNKEGKNITHVVFMGMGEPLNNTDAVIESVNAFTKNYGLSYRRVTVSTSGVVPKLKDLAERTHAALAVSLHAATDSLRTSFKLHSHC